MKVISYIKPVALKILMWFFFDEDNQVTWRTSSFSCIAPAAYIQLHAFLYTCRNVDTDCFFTKNSSFAFAGSAFCSDGSSFSVTGRAGSDCLHLTKKSILHFSYLAASSTCLAGLYTSFILRAACLA